MPCWVLDLYAEFRNITNGLVLPSGRSLLGALTWFGLDSLAAVEKQSMRELILRGGSYSAEERTQILNYCESDVEALAKLLPKIVARLRNLEQALHRGQFMKTVAVMEHYGVPIDRPIHSRLTAEWGNLRGEIVAEVDRDFGVFEGAIHRVARETTNRLAQADVREAGSG